MQTYIYKHMYSYIHACMPTCTHSSTYPNTPNTLKFITTPILTHLFTFTWICTLMHTHTLTHIYTNTHVLFNHCFTLIYKLYPDLNTNCVQYDVTNYVKLFCTLHLDLNPFVFIPMHVPPSPIVKIRNALALSLPNPPS